MHVPLMLVVRRCLWRGTVPAGASCVVCWVFLVGRSAPRMDAACVRCWRWCAGGVRAVFDGATSFNQPVKAWDVWSVTTMNGGKCELVPL